MTSSSVPLCRQYIITRSFCKVLQVDLGGAFAPAGDAPSPGQSLIPEGRFMSYNVQITQLDELIRGHNGARGGISAEAVARSAETRVGQERVSQGRFRGSPCH